MNMEKGKFTNLKKIHRKLTKIATTTIFFAVVIRRKRKFILATKKIWGVSGTLSVLLFDIPPNSKIE